MKRMKMMTRKRRSQPTLLILLLRTAVKKIASMYDTQITYSTSRMNQPEKVVVLIHSVFFQW